MRRQTSSKTFQTRRGPGLASTVAFGIALALPGMVQAQGTNSAYIAARLDTLQRSVAELSARLDQLRAQDQELQQRMERLQTSLGQRIERLEAGARGAPHAAPKPAPKTTPPKRSQ